jgi:hypothetical protein
MGCLSSLAQKLHSYDQGLLLLLAVEVSEKKIKKFIDKLKRN